MLEVLARPLLCMVMVTVTVLVMLLMLLLIAMAMAMSVFVLVVSPSTLFFTQAHSSTMAFFYHTCSTDDLAGHAALPWAWYPLNP